MNSRSTILVLTLAIGLGAYIAVFEVGQTPPNHDDSPSPIDSPATGTPLLPSGRLPADRVRTIRIETPGHDPVALQADPSRTKRWWQTEPIRYPARLESVTELIDTIRSLRFARSLDPDEAQRTDLTGLNPESETRYTLTGDDFEPLILAIGQSTGAGAGYLRLADSQSAYVVNDDLHRLHQTPKAWRDPTLTGIVPEGIHTVRIEDRSEGILQLQRMAGGWQITAPQIDRAATEQVQTLMKDVRETRVIDFVVDHPESLTAFGLDQPARVLNFHIKNTDGSSTNHRLLLGAATALESTQRFAMIEGTPSVLILPGSITLNTSPQADRFRDRRLTLMRPEDLQTLTITSTRSTLAIARQDGRWAFADQNKFAPDPGLLDRLLRELFGNRADGFAPVAPPPPAPDALQVDMTGLTAEQHEHLQIYPEGDHWWVIRKDEAIARRLPKARINLLTQSASELRDRVAMTASVDTLKSIHIQQPNTAFTITKDPAGSWPSTQYEKTAIDALLEQLSPLRVAAWIPETPTGWTATITVVLEHEDGTTTLEARPNDQPPTARLGRQASLFQLEPATAETLKAEFRHRMILNVERQRIASVSTPEWTLLHDAAGRLLLGDDTKPDSVRAAAIIDALAGLRAVKYVAPETVQFGAQAPHRSLNITLRHGQRHQLSLWSPDDQNTGVWIGRLDDAKLLFELEPVTAASLITSPRP